MRRMAFISGVALTGAICKAFPPVPSVGVAAVLAVAAIAAGFLAFDLGRRSA